MLRRIKIQLILLLVFSIFINSCIVNRRQYRCGLDPENFPKYGHDSKIIKYSKINHTDTLNSIINGILKSELKNDTLLGGVIELFNSNVSFRTSSDKFGKFRFGQIPTGKYTIKAEYLGFRYFLNDTIFLSKGDVLNIEILMGCIGQDDFK